MDALYGVAEVVYGFLESGPGFPFDLLWLAIVAIPVTFLHELGHAFVAQRLLGADVAISVGNVGKVVTLRLGHVTATVNALTAPTRAAGVTEFDGWRATAFDIVLIALAGPLASLAGAFGSAMALAAVAETGLVHDVLWALVFGNAFAFLLNLVPFEVREWGGRTLESDGRVALRALGAASSLARSS